jgi:hypothetical protein
MIVPPPFPPVQPLTYYVGEPKVTVSLSSWTHSYAESVCGPFTYILTTPRTALSLSLAPFELSLETTDHNQNMLAFSSEDVSLNTKLEGILYKIVSSDPY